MYVKLLQGLVQVLTSKNNTGLTTYGGKRFQQLRPRNIAGFKFSISQFFFFTGTAS